MEINPSRPNVIENADKIRTLASDVVRMANASHPMLDETYTRFVNEAIKAPSFAKLALKNAEYDSYIKATEDANNNIISRADCLNRYSATRSKLSELERSSEGMRIYDAMREKAINDITVSPTDTKVYKAAIKNAKNRMQKKIAVLAGLAEGSKQLVPCSCNKGIKKFTYRFLRLLNK